MFHWLDKIHQCGPKIIVIWSCIRNKDTVSATQTILGLSLPTSGYSKAVPLLQLFCSWVGGFISGACFVNVCSSFLLWVPREDYGSWLWQLLAKVSSLIFQNVIVFCSCIRIKGGVPASKTSLNSLNIIHPIVFFCWIFQALPLLEVLLFHMLMIANVLFGFVITCFTPPIFCFCWGGLGLGKVVLVIMDFCGSLHAYFEDFSVPIYFLLLCYYY